MIREIIGETGYEAVPVPERNHRAAVTKWLPLKHQTIPVRLLRHQLLHRSIQIMWEILLQLTLNLQHLCQLQNLLPVITKLLPGTLFTH